MILYDTHQATNSPVQENLVGVEEGRRTSMAHPLLCGIMVALLVLGIGLAAWALVGIDRRSQQLARSGDGDGRLTVICVMDEFIYLNFSRQLQLTVKAMTLSGRLQQKRFQQVKQMLKT